MGLAIKTELFFSLPSYYHQQYYSPSIVGTNVGDQCRDLKVRRRRRQRERQKNNRFKNQNNNVAVASCFFVHFFAVTARLRREYAWFHVLQRKYISDKIERTRIHFFSDVFASVAVLGS